MPTITVDGRSVDVEHGSKLVLAIEALGIDIGHRCGGKARCTTCRVEFQEGEPELFTRAEYRKLQDAGLLDAARLSCQVLVEHDMAVKVLKTLQSEGWADTGPAVALALTPDAERFARASLEAEAPLA
ncbi:MAG: (2Fe-2S)-binding protein [Trueperaceae bacterium]|nr:(2Fe-2S)-binding protein [Trueperaceae bacterium]